MEANTDVRYYGLSRFLFRAAVGCARRKPLPESERQRLLDSCEYAVMRIADNPESGAVVSRWLYREANDPYALEDRADLQIVLKGVITKLAPILEEMKRERSRDCSAMTRQGTPCRRESTVGSEYCPSHRHLGALSTPPA